MFVSGQVVSQDDGTAEPDFENLRATLEAADCTFDDIVDVTTFHTEPEKQFATIMAINQHMLSDAPYPNWTTVGVNWLSAFDFEIKVIARIPSPKE